MYTPDEMLFGAVLATALCALCLLVRLYAKGERVQRVSEALIVGFAVVAMVWWGLVRLS